MTLSFPNTFTNGIKQIGSGPEVMANLQVLKAAVEARSGTYLEGTFVLGTEYTPSTAQAAHVLATAEWALAGGGYAVAIFYVGAVEVGRVSIRAPGEASAQTHARTADFIVPAGKKWKALKEGESPALSSGLTRTLLL